MPHRRSNSSSLRPHARAIALAAALALTHSARAAAPSTTATTRDLHPPLAFGTEGFNIPPSTIEFELPPRTLDLLSEAFDHTSGPARLLYLTQLGTCGPDALHALLPHLSASDPNERATAVRAIADLAQSSAATQLQPLLSDPSALVRRETVLALARLHANAAITPALTDPSPDVQRAALSAASTSQQAQQIARALATQTPSLLVPSIDAISRAGDATQADAVAPFCAHTEIPVRAAAVRAIGRLKATAHQDSVHHGLADLSPTVRREAVTATITTLAIPQQQTQAITALADPDPTVRQAAADVLHQAPTPTALDALLAQLSTDYPPLHDAARAALVAIGAPAVGPSEKLANSSKPREQVDGVTLLAALNSSAAIDRRVELLDSPDWSVAAAAARSLSNTSVPPEQVGPHLLNLIKRDRSLANNDPAAVDAKAAAILLCGRLRYQPALPLLRPLVPFVIGSPIPQSLRLTAIWAIGVTASPGTAEARAVEAVHDDRFQADDAAFESFKAIINMNDPAAANLFKGWATDPTVNRDEPCRWIAHLGFEIATGQSVPFTPRAAIRTLDLSVAPVAE